jgi:hypothetical protein
VDGDLVAHLVDLTGRRRLHLRRTGNVTDVMRQALECATRAGARAIIIGVAGAGAGDLHPALPAGHRPVLARHGLRRRRGRTDVPKIVDWYMDGKIEIDPMITHTMPLDKINKGFDLMHAGELPNQVWFTCRQAELLLGKLNAAPVKEFESDKASFADLKALVAETISRIEAQTDTKDDFAEGKTTLELPGFPTLSISGQDYIDEWLTPNFYFHFVTAYDILRAEGLAIGKADYMSHLRPLLAAAAAG